MAQHDVSVFAVHTTRPDEGAGAIEVIFVDERSAQAYARSRSNDWRITSASVTRYTLGQLGTRHPVAWYQQGNEQDIRATRPDRRYYPTDHPCRLPHHTGELTLTGKDAASHPGGSPTTAVRQP